MSGVRLRVRLPHQLPVPRRRPAAGALLGLLHLLFPIAFLAAFLVVPETQAHNLGPLRTEQVSVGPYRVVVTFYDPPRPRRPIAFAVDPAPGTALPSAGGRPQVSVAIFPDEGQIREAVVASVGPHQDGGVPTGGVAGTFSVPAPGAWFLSIAIRMPDGETANGGLPLHAGEPPSIPAPLAWLAGLLPIWGLVGLIVVRAWRAWRAGGPLLAPSPGDPWESGENGRASQSTSRPLTSTTAPLSPDAPGDAR